MKSYNGHRSWNAWNVSLWINNDEALYTAGRRWVEMCKGNIGKAAGFLLREIGEGTRTPDGAVYNRLAIKLALED